MINNIWLAERQGQTFIAITILLLLCALFWGTPIFFLVPFLLGFGSLLLIKGFADPSLFCLFFYFLFVSDSGIHSPASSLPNTMLKASEFQDFT